MPRLSAAAVLVLALLASACGGGSSGGSGSRAAAGGAAHLAGAEAAPGSPVRPVAASSLPQLGPDVIQTATLTLGVRSDGLGPALDRAGRVADRLGGVVTSEHRTHGRDASGELRLRVPAQRFERALERLRALGKVRAESRRGRDVTGQVVDLQARIRNALAQRTALRRLMGRARSVRATLRVQDALAQTELTIEELRGRLRYLADRSALATLTVRFETAKPPAPSPPGQLSHAFARARHAALAVVAALIVGVGFAVPLAVLAGLALAAALGVRRSALAARRGRRGPAEEG